MRTLLFSMNPTPQQTLLRALALMAGFVLIVSSVFAQASASGTIHGRVLNAGTGAYLGNVEIRVVGTDLVTTTAPDGRYQLTQVPVGEQTISASYTGLDKLQQQVNVTPGAAASLDFSLTTGQYSEVVKLGEFIVGSAREGNAKAIVDQRMAPNIKNVIAA